jgi:haloalkane dehalogenase
MKGNDWIDREEYPFKSNFLELDMGKMHYIDEGSGEPFVMLHGNPTWSFLYRHLVKGLSDKYRCVAPDHIGFGLSDKPPNWSYLPKVHGQNVTQLIESLDLKDITLVVQDWGGPIGLSYAINNPENVRRLIIMNTWLWPVSKDYHFVLFSRFLGGYFGKYLILHHRFFEGFLMKRFAGKSTQFTKAVHSHYLSQFENPRERKGVWVFPKEIVGSTQWLGELWSQRENIKGIPTLLVWGMKDLAFREKELKTWEGLFSNSKTIRLDDIGHYVQEEMEAKLVPIVDEFLRSSQEMI